jgi:uncharacterized delta-60 repeat protein
MRYLVFALTALLLTLGQAGAQVHEQWVQRYNGPENSHDCARAIALDASGNVYVTGYSYGSSTDFDYATIKYNSGGVQQWVQRYNGLGNGSDLAMAIAVDALGNVYVTGQSAGSGTGRDYATIKYNSGGVQQWVQRYDGPVNNDDMASAIAVDASGNVYVTGASDTSVMSSSYATIKYNSGGVQQWVQRHVGPGNGRDAASAIAVDASGNVYVTGYSQGSSGEGHDYATIKYNSGGVQQWVQRYNGPANRDDEASAIVLDASGNVYVTGYSCLDPGCGTDCATIKYNSGGVQQWVQRYNGPGNSENDASAIALDASGNFYVTGSSNLDTNCDYLTIKYNSGGVQQWVQRYDGPGSFDDLASAIALDASGNVYVTGYSSGSDTVHDYETIKYNSVGVQQWGQRYNGPGNSYDAAFAIALDASGNVYVTGYSLGSGTSEDYATIKYVQDGPLCDLELLPTDANGSKLYLANTSVLWGEYTQQYPYTDTEFIGAVVRNDGPAQVDNVRARFLVEGLVIGDTIIPHMVAGETCVVDRKWALPDPSTENKRVEVMIDPLNEIPETNEDNNDYAENVSIYYAKRDRSPYPIPNRYDLRVDAYGPFSNYGWSSYDEAYQSYVQDVLHNPMGWTLAEQYMLGFLFPLYYYYWAELGHCYGMAASSIRYFDDHTLIPQPYDSTFLLPKELAAPDINRYQNTQFLDALWARCFPSPANTELGTLRQYLVSQQEPVVVSVPDHAVACYKLVSRPVGNLAYFYQNSWTYGEGQQWIPAYASIFDEAANRFAYDSQENLNFSWYADHPELYSYGFPYDFSKVSPCQQVWVRRPPLILGDWTRILLWDIWRSLFGGLAADGQLPLTISCPVKGLLTDNRGRRIGFVGDSLINEIPGATIDTNLTVEVYHLPDSLAYAVSTAAYDTGNMSIRFLLPVAESTVRLVCFDTIRISATTKTSLAVARADTGFRLQVDWDGNGITDTVLLPDFNDTISLREQQTQIAEAVEGVSDRLALQNASPNPFSGGTMIRYSLPSAASVSLEIYDAAGRSVRTLVNEQRKSGTYSVRWNGTDDKGRRVSPGIYFYSLRADGKVLQRKMVVLE